jgi:hypothetical protein
MMTNLHDYGHLWNGSESGWVLVRGISQPDRFNVYNLETRMMLVIENEQLAKRIHERMLAEGATVIDEIPPGGFVP